MILLPTLDFPPKRGGIARYTEAIKKTFPYEVNVSFWNDANIPSAKDATKRLLQESVGYNAIWVNHILPIGTAALRVFRKNRIPYVVFLHGMDFDLARRSFIKSMVSYRILSFAQTIVANSHALAKEIELFTGRHDVIVVYPPISDTFIEASQKPIIRSTKKIRLLTVARLVERKGHIKVLELLKDFPDVEYRIVGDGPYKKEIENKIKELKLSDRVSILADVNDAKLPAEYKNSHIFVMPTTKTKTDREGFGIVYLEAQLFGLPVIATKHPGVDESIIDKGSGFLIVDHPDALKFALRQLVNDATLRQRMGEAGREFVLGGFTRETQMKKLTDLL